MLSIVIVAEILLVLFASISVAASPKATSHIIGGVYSPGDDFKNVTIGGVASYGRATFYTPNADQPTSEGIYDIQYYNHPLSLYPDIPPEYQDWYPYYYGSGAAGSPYWYAPEHLHENIPSGTEYMVIVETINGVNDWTGANYTGSTNMIATGQTDDYLPNIYLEQIPTPNLKSINYTAGEIIINWTGLNENISDNCLDGLQSWKDNANNVLNYSVYRSINGGEFVRVGNSTPQVKGGEVFFVDTVEPGDYYYRIAVNYRYEKNTGTSVIDQNGVNPENTRSLPGIFVSTGRSNVSEIITMPSEPVIVLNSPNGGEKWTGGSVHDISYTISGGTSNYKVWLNYTIDGGTNWNPCTGAAQPVTRTTADTYTYPWTLPKINSTTVEVRVTVIDANSLSDWEKSAERFKIDSKAPSVVSTIPGNGTTNVGRTDSITVTFDEPMDASAKYAFTITPSAGNWSWTWISDTTMRGTHDQLFVSNTTYTCTINTTAKDKSLPGNSILANYSWSFTVVPGVSITITSPLGGEKWTGNSSHDIIYMVGGGTPNYTVYINYTVGGETFNIATKTNVDEGSHSCPWVLPTINPSSVTVVVKAIDILGATKSHVSSQFTIDSTKPELIIDTIIPGSNTIALLTQPVIIQFTEPMNTTSAEAAFSITPDPGGWLWTWNNAKDTMTGTHAPFISGTTYTCTINTTATDISVPGNLLNASYQWSFTAVAGKGDLRVVVDYPSSPEVGKDYKITVKIYNDGPKAINVSGSLTVTFYVNNKVIDTKTVHPIKKDESAEVSSKPFSFDGKGTWSIRVRVSSTNTADLVQGSAQPYEEVHTVNVAQPIGMGPYILIIVMVALVAVVGALTLFGIKKKKKTEK